MASYWGMVKCHLMDGEWLSGILWSSGEWLSGIWGMAGEWLSDILWLGNG